MNSFEPTRVRWRDERGHERGFQSDGGSCSYSRSYPTSQLAPEAPVHEVDERERRDQAEQAEQQQRAREMVDRVVDPLPVFLVLVCRADLLRDDPREPVARSRTLAPAVDVRRRAGRAPQLDPLLGGMSSARSDDLAAIVTSPRHPYRVAPRAAVTGPGAVTVAVSWPSAAPTRRPRPEVDVDDVVVGDREPLSR